MFGAIQQRHRRIIKMFYDCRHKEATQKERERGRQRAEQNKDSATEHKASFIMSSGRVRRDKEEAREEEELEQARPTGRCRRIGVDFTFIFTVNCNFHIHIQLPLVLH